VEKLGGGFGLQGAEGLILMSSLVVVAVGDAFGRERGVSRVFVLRS
jgi:hypothetical protein